MIDKLSYMWVCVCVKDSLNEDKLSARKYTNINHSKLVIGKTFTLQKIQIKNWVNTSWALYIQVYGYRTQ